MKLEWYWILSYCFTAYLYFAAVLIKFGISLFLDLLPALLIPVYLINSFSFLGLKKSLIFLVVSSFVSYFFEFVGTTTGIPFGRYKYSNFLQPFIGPVPALIPPTWSSLAYFCGISSSSFLSASIMMVALDLAFDPRLSPHLWQWLDQGQYFGVPISNFAGWFFTSASIFLLCKYLSLKVHVSSRKGFVFYFLFGFSQSFTDFMVGLLIPALVSALVFSSFIFLFIYSSKANQSL